MTVLIKGLRYGARKLFFLADKFEFKHCNPSIFNYPDCFETIRVLSRFINPRYVCDIGANYGNWSYVMHQMNPELKHVVMFEPQLKLQKVLHTLDLNDVNKIIYPYGLGMKEEKVSLQGGTASASVLSTTNAQDYFFPGSINNENEEIEVKILDKIYHDDNLPYPDVIKLDVQGYELNVLKGATHVLSQSKYLVIELSFCEFYSGQPNLKEIIQFLDDHNYSMVARGYECIANFSPYQLLQTDGIFVNRHLIPSGGI